MLIVRSFNFEIELKDYKKKIDILIDGRDLKLYWGEESYELGYEYDCDHLNEVYDESKLT